jgi:hypothetical protein
MILEWKKLRASVAAGRCAVGDIRLVYFFGSTQTL